MDAMIKQAKPGIAPSLAPSKGLFARLFDTRFDMLWLAGGVLLVSVVTFLFGLWGSGGRLAPPLDDTFIHFQYARQLAAGHPFEYNTGDPPSSGDSAFIYPFMLAPAYLLGLDGQKPLFYADALNFLAHLAAVLLLYKMALRLGGRPLALLSALFLLLDGRLNYIFMSGMETGIYAGALVAFFWLWLRDVDRGRFAWLAGVGVFASLLRPESHILVSLVCVLTLIYLIRKHGFAWKYGLLLLPVLLGMAQYLANIAMTGDWQFNTAASKSIWYLPYTSLQEKVSLTVGYFITLMKNTILGLEVGRSPFPLLGAPLAVLGAGVALNDMRHRFFHSMLVLTFLAGNALALLLPPIQFNRYYHPYDFIFLLYFSIGLIWLIKLAARLTTLPLKDSVPTQHSALGTRYSVLGTRHYAYPAIAVVALLLPQFFGYFFAFGDSTRDIYYQQMTFSEWVKQNTPPDARIGVNDIGAHKYIGDRYLIDLIGLTDNSLRGAYFSGWGTIYDKLVSLPESERPTHLLIHPNVFLNGIQESVAESFLTPVYSIRLPAIIITAGDTEVLYKVNWGAALLDPVRPRLLRSNQEPLDDLNVGDTASEKGHAYDIEGRLSTISEQKAIVTTAPYEAEGFTMTESGRRHTGWEEFTVKSQPGNPLVVVSRSRLNRDATQTLMVLANGRQVGLWKVENERGGMWQEYEFTIPADFITSTQTRVRIDSTFDPGGPGFTSYRYWFYGP
jgi:hypothetical protein